MKKHKENCSWRKTFDKMDKKIVKTPILRYNVENVKILTRYCAGMSLSRTLFGVLEVLQQEDSRP